MNGDDHDRILRLEDKMDTMTEKLASLSGSLKVWAVILGLVASVAGTVVTNKLTAPSPPPDTHELIEAVDRLEAAIREQKKLEANR